VESGLPRLLKTTGRLHYVVKVCRPSAGSGQAPLVNNGIFNLCGKKISNDKNDNR